MNNSIQEKLINLIKDKWFKRVYEENNKIHYYMKFIKPIRYKNSKRVAKLLFFKLHKNTKKGTLHYYSFNYIFDWLYLLYELEDTEGQNLNKYLLKTLVK